MATAQDPNLIDPTFFNQVSQIAHFFTTYAITLTAFVIFGETAGFVTFGGCELYAVIHEFWWDPRHENAVTRGSDWVDFFWLSAGTLLGVLIGILVLHTKLRGCR